MARLFWQDFPPTSPVLAQWGADFPHFIETFEPAQSLPFLADVARLEWFWLRAYHAADATPLSIDVLSQLSETALEENSLMLHPSFAFIVSSWPIVSIWQEHQQETHNFDFEISQENTENALIVRPHYDIHIIKADETEKTLIQACLKGASITKALETIADCADPITPLVQLFQRGMVIGLKPIPEQRAIP